MSGLVVHGVMRAADARRLGCATVAFADLAAVVSAAPEDDADETRRTIALAERHHAVLSGVAADCDILPVRLGAVFADEVVAALKLAEAADQFRHGLTACADCVELSLVVEDLGAPPAPLPSAVGGVDYLKARAAALAAARARPARLAAALDALQADLEPHARAFARRPVAAPRLLDLAALVQRRATSAVLGCLNLRQAELARMGLAAGLRGPWPVYSFASLAAASLS